MRETVLLECIRSFNIVSHMLFLSKFICLLRRLFPAPRVQFILSFFVHVLVSGSWYILFMDKQRVLGN